MDRILSNNNLFWQVFDGYFSKVLNDKQTSANMRKIGGHLMTKTLRDYSLLGKKDSQKAVETGLASAKWYSPSISRKELKAFMKRSDGPAIRDTIIWLISLVGFAVLAIIFWPSLWSIPFWLAYGILYGSSTDSRCHECGHGTALKTR